MTLRVSGLGVLVVVAACSSATRDAPPDASDVDAVDAAPAIDAAWTTDVACSDAVEALYGMAAGQGARGSIVGCAAGDAMDTAAVQAQLTDGGAEGVVAETGARIVRVAYRTVRSDGSPAVTTATVYLPLVPRAVPAPVVLVGRSTAGLADSCAPSKEDMPQRNLALPFAARGFVTITPDFAGLGNAGTHAYLDNHEAAAELFDGALALRALVPGAVGDPIAAVGYSQGGGVVLSAQGLELALTGKHTLRAVAAFAPEWPISTRSFGYENVLRNPNNITALAGLSTPTVAVLRHYGFMANRMGQADGSFPEAERASLVSEIESLCTVPLGGALDAQQPHLGDLIDPTFRAQVLACIDGQPGCEGNGAAFFQWMTSDFVTADPAGARVLVAQGLADQVMPAASEAACDVAKLRAEGVTPDLCVDDLATHESVVGRKIEGVVAWVEAVVSGAPAPACGGQQLPTCSQ